MDALVCYVFIFPKVASKVQIDQLTSKNFIACVHFKYENTNIEIYDAISLEQFMPNNKERKKHITI